MYDLVMLIPLRPPKNDADLVNNDYYWGYCAHPRTLFEKCDHTACDASADHYLLWESKFGGQQIGSRCSKCLPLVGTSEVGTMREITRDEVIIFIIMAS
jgi:hypothetical protein